MSEVTIHAFRLHPGQDLKKEIEQFVHQHKIQAGWIVTCVGSLTQTNLRYANKSVGTSRTGPVEIVSLVGTLCMDGVHLHMSVSDGDGNVWGGHLLEGNPVYTTAEVVIGVSNSMSFTRKEDVNTGFRELYIS